MCTYPSTRLPLALKGIYPLLGYLLCFSVLSESQQEFIPNGKGWLKPFMAKGGDTCAEIMDVTVETCQVWVSYVNQKVDFS